VANGIRGGPARFPGSRMSGGVARFAGPAARMNTLNLACGVKNRLGSGARAEGWVHPQRLSARRLESPDRRPSNSGHDRSATGSIELEERPR
jgi:hypothetical protein